MLLQELYISVSTKILPHLENQMNKTIIHHMAVVALDDG